jgi:hypothetical protein
MNRTCSWNIRGGSMFANAGIAFVAFGAALIQVTDALGPPLDHAASPTARSGVGSSAQAL